MRGIERTKDKIQAIKLRRRGLSIGKIEKLLGIHRSTLSGWLKDVQLTQKQQRKLRQDWKKGLIHAREKAVLWHNAEKEKRLQVAKKDALETLGYIDTNNKHILDLALAMLYLGEGSKKADETSMGNSDPLILKTFIEILKRNYSMDIKKLRCELYLRADQKPKKLVAFWSRELAIPKKNFRRAYLDQRTTNSKTYPTYKGVCMVRYNNVAIKRKLLDISKVFCENLIHKRL